MINTATTAAIENKNGIIISQIVGTFFCVFLFNTFLVEDSQYK
jgi:hypothetical protein